MPEKKEEKKTKSKTVKKEKTESSLKETEKKAVKKTAARKVKEAAANVESEMAEVMVAADGKAVKPARKTSGVSKAAKEEKPAEEKKTRKTVKAVKVKKAEEVVEEKVEEKVEEPVVFEEPVKDLGPRRSVAFIGSECYPFVKTGGLADVMYALPKELVKQNCDVKVILPRYKCIPWKYQEKMVYRGEFYMDLCSDGRQFYVGIMEY